MARGRVDEVARLVDLTDKEMARILNMSVRGLHAKTPAEPLSLAAGERLLLFERLVQHGLTIFDGRADLLVRWLRTPLAELAYLPQDSAGRDKPMATPVRDMGGFGQSGPTCPAATSAGSGTVVPGSFLSESFQSLLAVLDTVSGFTLADDVLGRIEWGIVG